MPSTGEPPIHFPFLGCAHLSRVRSPDDLALELRKREKMLSVKRPSEVLC